MRRERLGASRSLPCVGVGGSSQLRVALCRRRLPKTFLEAARDLGPGSKVEFPRIPPKPHMGEW